MSKHSPHVVEDAEQLGLFVFFPMHHIDRNGNAKPNIFSHVHVQGRSVQRDAVATPNELIRFTQEFLQADDRRTWKGVISAKCNDVRSIRIDRSLKRAACIYDTAEMQNPAHAEIGQTQYVEDDDAVELRHNLLMAFGNGVITQPARYRSGAVWNSLSRDLQARTTESPASLRR